jgi:hypothetical protein
MSGKLLFVIQSGPENHYNVLWGLRMAKNTWTHPYGEKILDDVKVLLFGRGVGIINPKLAESPEFEESILELNEVGVEVAACVSIAEPLGLMEEAESLGVKLVHASQYVAQKVSEGYTVMNF